MSQDAPRPVLNIAEHLGLLILEWAEREDAWVIIAHDGRKYVVLKDSPMTQALISQSKSVPDLKSPKRKEKS